MTKNIAEVVVKRDVSAVYESGRVRSTFQLVVDFAGREIPALELNAAEFQKVC